MAKSNEETSDGKAKQTKSLRKVSKAKKPLEINRWMVIHALNKMNNAPAIVKKGHSLAAIRTYIKKNHGLSMSYPRQQLLKSIIEDEFLSERISMTNSDAPSVNFTKRFEALVKAEEAETTSEETDGTTDEDEE